MRWEGDKAKAGKINLTAKPKGWSLALPGVVVGRREVFGAWRETGGSA
jgi:hypothetical protein